MKAWSTWINFYNLAHPLYKQERECIDLSPCAAKEHSADQEKRPKAVASWPCKFLEMDSSLTAYKIYAKYVKTSCLEVRVRSELHFRSVFEKLAKGQLILRQELSCDSSNAGWDFFETRKLRVVLGKMVQEGIGFRPLVLSADKLVSLLVTSHDSRISWTSSHQWISQHPLSWTTRRRLDGCTQRCHHCLMPFISKEEEREVRAGPIVYSPAARSLFVTLFVHNKWNKCHCMRSQRLSAPPLVHAWSLQLGDFGSLPPQTQEQEQSLLQQSKFQSKPFGKTHEQLFWSRKTIFFARHRHTRPTKSSLICCPCKLAHKKNKNQRHLARLISHFAKACWILNSTPSKRFELCFTSHRAENRRKMGDTPKKFDWLKMWSKVIRFANSCRNDWAECEVIQRRKHSDFKSWIKWWGRWRCLLFRLGSQRWCSIKRPVSPSRSSQTVLEKHSDDSHHGQSSIGQLRCQLAFACLRILDFANEIWKANTIVARLCAFGGVLHRELPFPGTSSIRGRRCLEETSGLDQPTKGNNLSSAKDRQPVDLQFETFRYFFKTHYIKCLENNTKICGTWEPRRFERAASPFGTSENLRPREGDKKPGNL